MTESESMYYLHTCLSHISIQPLLAFVGTTVTKGIPGTSFNPCPAKWSRSVQGVVHDLKHIWTEPLAKGRLCWIILGLVEIKQHQSVQWHHQHPRVCSAPPSQELYPWELLPPHRGSPPQQDSARAAGLTLKFATSRISRADASLLRVTVPENLVNTQRQSLDFPTLKL